MKKLLSLVFITVLTFGAQAQDKKFQIGLVLGPTFNWTKIQTTKIEKNGIGTGFTIGLGGNYMFNENIGLAMGIQFDLESFKLNYGNAASPALGEVFYAYEDTDILKYEDNVVQDFTDTTAFQLMTRKFKSKYVTIPLFLKFSTSLIGKFKYYGKFGMRTSILASVRMDDTGYDAAWNSADSSFNTITPLVERTQTDMRPVTAKKELLTFRTSIGVYGGFEWNFTGSTFLYTEFGFNYGITPNLWQESATLVDKITGGTGAVTYENLDINKNPIHLLELKVGLLF